jgi:hypothetical protein
MTDTSSRETREAAVNPDSGVSVPDLSVEWSRDRRYRVPVRDLSAPGVTDLDTKPEWRGIPHLE